jgi:hypothetical protein
MTPEQKRRWSGRRRREGSPEKAAAEKARAAEKDRQTEIRKIVAQVRLPASVADEAIQGDKTVDQVREIVIAELAKQSEATEVRNANPSVTAGKDAGEKFREGASAWIIQRAGVAETVQKHQGGKLLDAGEFRGMSLREIARESLERANVKTRGLDVMKMVGMALTHRAGYQTASDFSVLLENTLHKILLASYGVTPDTWSRFCAKGQVSDFRAHNRYRQGTFGSLDALTEHGEFKNKVIPDGEKASITAGTKGNIIALSRQAIVNDDMGAFSNLAMRFGRAAKLSVEVDVYALLALNSGLGPTVGSAPLFDASHANIGTGAALSAASVDADRVVMSLQKDRRATSSWISSRRFSCSRAASAARRA